MATGNCDWEWESWAGFLNELTHSIQRKDSAEEKQLDLAYPVGSSSVSNDSRPSPEAPRLWWARLLKEHSTFKMRDHDPTKPVTLVSGCSGLCSEAEALKASEWQRFHFLYISCLVVMLFVFFAFGCQELLPYLTLPGPGKDTTFHGLV